MVENKGGITFVNCIGSDINLWKKGANNETFEWETCLLYDEPEYSSEEINSSWKFVDHITKRHLVGNGKRVFHYQDNECPSKRVEITTPLYTLKELCTYTIATRLLLNNNTMKINSLEIPKELKVDLESCTKYLMEMYEKDGDCFKSDWTINSEEDYNS